MQSKSLKTLSRGHLAMASTLKFHPHPSKNIEKKPTKQKRVKISKPKKEIKFGWYNLLVK